jgi:gas vesicle protein
MIGKGSIKIGILGGLIVGGIAAILLAPRSGAETRAMLSERAEPFRAKADELVRPTVERTRQRIAPFADRIRRSRSGLDTPREEAVEETAAAA